MLVPGAITVKREVFTAFKFYFVFSEYVQVCGFVFYGD